MHDALKPTPEEALQAWAARVRGNREQAERVREAPERPDFYAPIASVFAADPHRTDEPTLDLLRSMVQPGETWLDIGAGGGRYALPLALLANEVIALDPSNGMLDVLRASMAEHDVRNVRILQSRWPSEESVHADVCLISHVGYDIEAIGPFLDAMEASARRICVAVLLARSPASAAEPFWPAVHGEPRVPLPALPEFLALLLARGKLFEVHLGARPPLGYPSLDALVAFLRQQLFVEPGSAKDRLLQELAREHVRQADGRFWLSSGATPLGVVTWKPG
jgi:SAM-dependent methyltransferase